MSISIDQITVWCLLQQQYLHVKKMSELFFGIKLLLFFRFRSSVSEETIIKGLVHLMKSCKASRVSSLLST